MPDAMVSFDIESSPSGLNTWEMFIDLSTPGGGTGAPSTLDMAVPAGWTVKDIKLYSKTVAGDDDRKQRDIASLRGQNPSYSSVFDGSNPDHYTFTAGNPGKLAVQTGATAVEFDFLIWLQKDDGTNSFADPGIRNKG